MFNKDDILAAASQARDGRCVTGLVQQVATKRHGIIIVVDDERSAAGSYHLDDGAIAPGIEVGKRVQLTIDDRGEVIASKVVA